MEQRLAWLLAQHNPPLQLFPVPGDGDCLVHSIKAITRDPRSPDEIRRAVAQYVKENDADSSLVKVALGGRSARSWASTAKKSGEWLETDFAIIYCEMHGLRPPNFFMVGSKGQLVQGRPYDPHDLNLAHSDDHYQPVVPMQGHRQYAMPTPMPRPYAPPPAPSPFPPPYHQPYTMVAQPTYYAPRPAPYYPPGVRPAPLAVYPVAGNPSLRYGGSPGLRQSNWF